MASNIDITLKRYNGTDYDVILPTTHLGQIFTDITLQTTLSSYLSDTYIPLSQKGAASGVATLDTSGKVTASQLPAYIFGGMTYAGLLDLSTNKTLDDIMEDSDPGDTANKLSAIGEYLQVSNTGVLEQGSTWSATILAPGDEGVTTFPIVLEAGDWIVISAYDDVAKTVDLGIVNNTYQDATTTLKGLVKLSEITNVQTASGNAVITDGVLSGLVDTEESDLSGTDGAWAGVLQNAIAPARHIHDNRYRTRTEISNYFAGDTAISGYNKTNWDNAYDWGDHSLVGYLTEESLADLTDITLTDPAANDILRYNGSAWVNDGNFKPILYGTGQTSSITGAIIIETD